MIAWSILARAHGPGPLAHWSWVRPWSMGPGLGPGQALVNEPRLGPWPWPIGPGSGPAGPGPGPMALAHWSRVRPWSVGPGLDPGPALVHGPRPGPWAWPIGPGSGPGAWAGPGPWAPAHGPGRVKKTVFTVFLLSKVFTFFLDFISTVPGNVEMKSPPNGGHSISTFPGHVQNE